MATARFSRTRVPEEPFLRYLCVVTGARVRIGYQIVLRLLRCGARVIATTRWPADALLRYASEHDFGASRGGARPAEARAIARAIARDRGAL